MLRVAALLAILLLSGCAHVAPYCNVALSGQINEYSDELLHNDRDYQCSKNVKFDAECGVETRQHIKAGIRHRSNLLCGGPFNDRPETYELDVRISGEIGGWK